MRLMVALLAVLVVLAPAPAWAAKRRALLVGANKGWDEPRLRFARDDAHKLREVLIQLGGFEPEDIVLLEDPEVHELREALEAMKRRFGAPSDEATLFVFYYSGHADRDFLHLQGHPQFSAKDLLLFLDEMPATQKLGILDSCNSGSLLKGAKPAPFAFDISKKGELGVWGTALLVSSTADEPSQESTYLGGSFFTHHLVSGLFGQADENADRRVSLEEVARYSRERTTAATVGTLAGPQHPGSKGLTGYSELYLTFLKGPRVSLQFPPGWPRCFLTDRKESRLLAEISPALTARQVDVPPGSYALKCEDSTRLLRVAPFEARAGDRLDVVTAMTFTDVPRSEGLVKGTQPLSTRLVLPILSGGALASGGVFWALSRKEQSRLRTGEPPLTTPDEVRASISRGKSYQALGYGLMGVGIVGLGAATGMYLLREPKAPVPSVGVTTTGTAVFVQGRWP